MVVIDHIGINRIFASRSCLFSGLASAGPSPARRTEAHYRESPPSLSMISFPVFDGIFAGIAFPANTC
jgi:hypothetical protein